MSLELYLAYILACAVIALIPGPTVTVIIANSLRHGARAGLLNVAGTQLGLALMMAVLVVGLSSVIAAMGWLFEWLRWAGAAYLVWIGIQALRHRSAFSIEAGNEAKALMTIYKQSVIGNMLNPKVTLFFLAFLPQFVNAGAGNIALQLVLLGVVFMIVTIVVFGAVAIFAGAIGNWVRRKPAIGKRLNVFAGLTFIALGIRVALPDLK